MSQDGGCIDPFTLVIRMVFYAPPEGILSLKDSIVQTCSQNTPTASQYERDITGLNG